MKKSAPSLPSFGLSSIPIALLILSTAGGAAAANFYSGISPATVPWTNGIVPYEFTNTLTAAQQQTYLDGLREWELAANVKFVPRTSETRWILFAFNSNNFNNVSVGYNPQVVNVSSLSRAQVCHEMGHSFGFTHENIRPDRTNYLTVLSNNVTAGNLVWFAIDPNSVTNGPYDFESVMHLGWDFDSVAPGVLATQQPKPPFSPRYRFRMGNYTLSPGDRAALAYLYGPPAVPLTNIVITTADTGPGSLRAAMYYVTDHPGSVVRFDIPTSDPGYSNGVFTIHLTGHLPTLATDGIVIDGSTQPGVTGKPLIVVDASQIIPETFTPDTLLIYSANNQVKNLALRGFNWNGVTLLYADATNNTVAGCWIGLDASGTNAAPNAQQGILIDQGANRNIVGGTNALARNVISGNREYGIFITNAAENRILGNYVGTDASGSSAVPNERGGIILVSDSRDNVIGNTNVLARNVISGNTNFGVWISGATTRGNIVRGNYVGLDASGSSALPNTFAGLYLLDGTTSNLIANNVFSGQPSEGMRIADTGTSFNTVQGNYFGTDASGLNVVANGYAGLTIFGGASSNVIGGATAESRNILGGGYYGFVAGGAGTSGNDIEGNYVGLGPDGATPVPNYFGVLFSDGATNNVLGGTMPGARNIISGNSGSGVFLADEGTSGNFIQGNFIGTDPTGASAIPNASEGIYISGAIGNFIGGLAAGAGNVISGNGLRGIFAYGTNSSDNVIQGNFIGTQADGKNPLGNGWDGVVFFDGASGNIVGLATDGSGAGNTIAFNGFTGVYVGSDNPDASVGNTIRGNRIFENGYLGINLVGGSEDFAGVTSNDADDSDAGANNLQNFPEITNASASGSMTTISGMLSSAPGREYIVDIYRSDAADPSGYGEGQIHVGSLNATTALDGTANFGLSATGNWKGQIFTATATDTLTGDTSEFSFAVAATNAPPAGSDFAGPVTMTSTGFVATLSLTIGQSYRVQAATNLGNTGDWSDLTNFSAGATNIVFFDPSATNFPRRFYRIVSP